MANTNLFRETMKAAALGDSAAALRLDSQIPDVERESYNIYVTAMFCCAVEHRFSQDRSHAAITQFVNEMRYDFREANPPIKPLMIEGLVRAVFGEEHFLDEISAVEQLRAQLLAIRKIVDQSEQMQERLDDYLKDAETLTIQWAAEDE